MANLKRVTETETRLSISLNRDLRFLSVRSVIENRDEEISTLTEQIAEYRALETHNENRQRHYY